MPYAPEWSMVIMSTVLGMHQLWCWRTTQRLERSIRLLTAMTRSAEDSSLTADEVRAIIREDSETKMERIRLNLSDYMRGLTNRGVL